MIDLSGADLLPVCVLSDNVATPMQLAKNENRHAVHH